MTTTTQKRLFIFQRNAEKQPFARPTIAFLEDTMLQSKHTSKFPNLITGKNVPRNGKAHKNMSVMSTKKTSNQKLTQLEPLPLPSKAKPLLTSNLFGLFVIDKEKKSYNIDTWCWIFCLAVVKFLGSCLQQR
jgi:hypothetical protein